MLHYYFSQFELFVHWFHADIVIRFNLNILKLQEEKSHLILWSDAWELLFYTITTPHVHTYIFHGVSGGLSCVIEIGNECRRVIS